MIEHVDFFSRIGKLHTIPDEIFIWIEGRLYVNFYKKPEAELRRLTALLSGKSERAQMSCEFSFTDPEKNLLGIFVRTGSKTVLLTLNVNEIIMIG